MTLTNVWSFGRFFAFLGRGAELSMLRFLCSPPALPFQTAAFMVAPRDDAIFAGERGSSSSGYLCLVICSDVDKVDWFNVQHE